MLMMERLRMVKGRCSVTCAEANQLGLGPQESLLSAPWTCFCLLPKPTIWGMVQMVSLQGAGGRVVREGEGLEGQEQVAIGSSLSCTSRGLFPSYPWFFFLSLLSSQLSRVMASSTFSVDPNLGNITLIEELDREVRGPGRSVACQVCRRTSVGWKVPSRASLERSHKSQKIQPADQGWF